MRAAAAGALEPARQRGEVHARGRSHRRQRAGRTRGPRNHGEGQRARNRSVVSSACLRAVPPRGVDQHRAPWAASAWASPSSATIVEAHGGTVTADSDWSGFRLGVRRPNSDGAARRDWITALRQRCGDDECSPSTTTASTQELVATMLLMAAVSVRTAGRASDADPDSVGMAA